MHAEVVHDAVAPCHCVARAALRWAARRSDVRTKKGRREEVAGVPNTVLYMVFGKRTAFSNVAAYSNAEAKAGVVVDARGRMQKAVRGKARKWRRMRGGGDRKCCRRRAVRGCLV